MKKFFIWVADQLADGLEKSTVGAIVFFVTMGCIVYLVVKEGGTETVDSLLTMAMIVSASLMGINSVADIFKRTDNRTITRNETLNQTINRTEHITTDGDDCQTNQSGRK